MDLLQTAFGPSAQNPGKRQKNGKTPHRGTGEKMVKKWENRPKMAEKWDFGAIFARFRAEGLKAVCNRSTGS